MSQKRKVITKCMSLIISGVLLGTFLLPTAQALYGEYVTITSGSRKFQARSEIVLSHLVSNNTMLAWATTFISRTDGSKYSIGDVGARARVYRSDAVLLGSTQMVSNSKTGTMHSAAIDRTAARGSAFYATGTGSAWNASTNAYVTLETPRTRNLQN